MLLSRALMMTFILLSSSALLQLFLQRSSAGQLLSSRRRRANSFMEEMLPASLERECYEESCSQEEAAEIFQTREKTLEFWYRYTNLDPCRINPCLNGGICAVDREGFLCLCPPEYQGKTCDMVAFPCGRQRNQPLYRGRSLQSHPHLANVTAEMDAVWDEDNNSSVSRVNTTEEEWLNLNVTSTERGGNGTEEEEGGDTRIVGGRLEKQGESPWQVLIRRSDGFGFCGGTLVSDRWVVSAAHCFQETPDHVTIGDYDKKRPDPGEQVIKVQKVVVHPHFHSFTYDSDVALLYLAQPVVRGPAAIPACLPDAHLAQYLLRKDNRGMVSGWGVTQYLGRSSRFLRKVALPVVSQRDCMLSTEQVITDNMFCAGYLQASMDACSGDSGGPFVVNFRGTWFLTGVVSWGEQCAAKGKYGVYVRLGNFLGWIRDTMEKQEVNVTES
ncbi:coagulation factor X [Diretmus argenteus]